jgi:hypothetical protein
VPSSVSADAVPATPTERPTKTAVIAAVRMIIIFPSDSPMAVCCQLFGDANSKHKAGTWIGEWCTPEADPRRPVF